ncbi:MAG TPA: hypothetical protein VF270_01100 [Ignavibacteriaceae bacterium]
MAANFFIPKHKNDDSHILRVEKHLLEKYYDHLTVNIRNRVLIAYGNCKPSKESITYTFKLKFTPGNAPAVYVTDPQITYDDEIHMYSTDNRLCLYYPKDYSWNDKSHLFNTIVPWTHEWFLFYELYQVTGKWLHPYVDHRKI